MKKLPALFVAALIALSAGSAMASDVAVNDGDAIKISATTGLTGNMRFVAKEMAANSSVDLLVNEGFVQFTFRPRYCRDLAAYSGAFDGYSTATPIVVDPRASSRLSGVRLIKIDGSHLRIVNNTSNTLLVTGYIMSM